MTKENIAAANKALNSFISEYLRPATFPVAVRLTHEELPENVKTARQTYKHPLAICQGITIARRVGRTLGFEHDDHDCPVCHVLFGLSETPEMVTNGEIVYPLYARDLEAGRNTAAREFRLEPGTVKNIILAPLHRADFEPDVLIVYGNAAQVVRMVQGALFHEGGAITSNFSGRGACSGSIAYPYKTRQCNVVIPGGGERVFAMTCDDELCFAIPGDRIASVMEGVKATHDCGVARIPTPFAGIGMKPVFPKSYNKLSEYCGLMQQAPAAAGTVSK
jgi:uncharacterized protein (DUF169 family)